ncbi:WecB/TagA/CpsF family glycosyltransferase [Fructilactobacillus fructivorans]|uniref:N-acetylglucosaminyldiphosphoundecaprenol N-acetyl-beta-D-mannosaminyltransferase n=1 Tax=Fructilactobacillus fructivorans TaxID=1614 RepID=A0A0C1Q1P2_9LACO|nr:WecB/TagA/CpsF family glycosyltransferase [Fructilactobacillus fructivorans]KID41733.1 N-acetylmannosaminyltransferase [Fructilactobacillus fructivorans]MCT0151386.1 glycosyltransferase [Fructilactobacillus fructivorans]MCT2867537.1 glycosyltransferase [Fructilactobacillus fructivorans]MCT2868945.1 glycosyltransferase [Fructilactobacillus fructivorans]MCT2873885.1 glycosyltransferase [Fructilactobacillus fructivorans]
MTPKFKTTNIVSIPFVNTTFNDFMRTLEARINDHKNTFVVTANPEIVVYADHHPQYQKILKSATYVVPDGIGIIKGAQMLNDPISERITGYDIFCRLLEWGNQNNKSAYFLGAKPEVVFDLRKILTVNYPNLNIVGMQDGYFKNETPIVSTIENHDIDMIFVATGFPFQEEFIEKYRNKNNGLWIGVGGSFDVLAGHTQRAPQFWIDHHIEWLYRLIKQPTRFKRMLAIPEFLKLVRKQKKDER